MVEEIDLVERVVDQIDGDVKRVSKDLESVELVIENRLSTLTPIESASRAYHAEFEAFRLGADRLEHEILEVKGSLKEVGKEVERLKAFKNVVGVCVLVMAVVYFIW